MSHLQARTIFVCIVTGIIANKYSSSLTMNHVSQNM